MLPKYVPLRRLVFPCFTKKIPESSLITKMLFGYSLKGNVELFSSFPGNKINRVFNLQVNSFVRRGQTHNRFFILSIALQWRSDRGAQAPSDDFLYAPDQEGGARKTKADIFLCLKIIYCWSSVT